MAVAGIQGANRHIRSSLWLCILPKNIGELNLRPSGYKKLALPLSPEKLMKMSYLAMLKKVRKTILDRHQKLKGSIQG